MLQLLGSHPLLPKPVDFGLERIAVCTPLQVEDRKERAPIVDLCMSICTDSRHTLDKGYISNPDTISQHSREVWHISRRTCMSSYLQIGGAEVLELAPELRKLRLEVRDAVQSVLQRLVLPNKLIDAHCGK